MSAPGERLVFLVRSEGDLAIRYRVDLEADGYRGVCDCRDYQCRVAPARRLNPDRLYVCKHIEKAASYFGWKILRQIKAAAVAAHGTSASDVGPS